MCGKVNPPDRETCQYCEARLKPIFPDMSDDQISELLGLKNPSKDDVSTNQPDASTDSSMDWLYQLRSEEADEDVDNHQIEDNQSLERFEDWFNHPEDEDVDQNTPPKTDSHVKDDSNQDFHPYDENGLPGWLSSGLDQDLDEQEQQAEPFNSKDWLSPSETDELQSFDGKREENNQTGNRGEQAEPDWLLELESNSQEVSAEEINPEAEDGEQVDESLDFQSDNLLTWNREGNDTNVQSEAGNQEDLQSADLPSWLEAMRPVSALSPSDDNLQSGPVSVEGAGPLAGLQGVIPAEPDIAYSRKPFKYSVKLQVSEHQQAHAALLENLIQAEGKASVISTKEIYSPRNILRSVLALLLIGSILVIFIVPGLLQVNAPGLADYPSAWAAYQEIEKVGPGEPVLLAIDYQAGLSAEMDAVAGAVLKHLISRNAKIVMVTTHPLGSMQAERLLNQSSQATGIKYLPSQDYSNLGYIPGGHSGLLSFISDPRRTLPFALDGSATWQQPVFQTITDITGFSSLVIATEDADTARVWIEQLSSYSSSPPTIMAVSAQVEPVVAPYFQASPSQIQGIIPGLAGAIAYESAGYYPGGILQTYSPFSLAGLLAVIIILVGSLFAGFSALLPTQKKRERNRGDGK